MHVALLANLKKNAPVWPGISPDRWDDLDSEETIQSITRALEAGGHRVTFLEGDVTLYDSIRKVQPDICFNICEGHFGDSREAQVPALLEMLRIPYTGSQVLTLALTLDKPMTKRVLTYHALSTPDFQVFERVDEFLEPAMSFPLFVKPSREGTGMGVSAESIVRNESELRTQLRRIFERYDQPVLVEPESLLMPKLVGLDGNAKMSKSLGNAIFLSDPPEEVKKKVSTALTDPARIHPTDKGHPDVCVVFAYHKVFNPEGTPDIEERCKAGTIGCVPCKKLLVDVLNRFLAPIRERRAVYEKDPAKVWDILDKGTARAREEGAATMALVRQAMKIDYFQG